MGRIFQFQAVSGVAILTLLVVLLSNVINVLGQEEATCRGQPLNMTDKQMESITSCMGDMGIQSIFNIPSEKLSCFAVCVLDKKGLLTKDGKLDHDRIFAYVEMVMNPPEVKQPLRDGIDKCFQDHGDRMVIDNDPECTIYKETGACVHTAFLELCT